MNKNLFHLILFSLLSICPFYSSAFQNSTDQIIFTNITPIQTNKKTAPKKSSQQTQTNRSPKTNKKQNSQTIKAANQTKNNRNTAKKPAAKTQARQPAPKNSFTKNSAKVIVNNKNYQSFWDKGTFPTVANSIEYHTKKHANGQSFLQYTDKAINFYEQNKNLRREVTLNNGSTGYKITKGKEGGYWTKNGKIITFWVDP